MKLSIITLLLCAIASSFCQTNPLYKLCQTLVTALATQINLQPGTRSFNQALYDDYTSRVRQGKCAVVLAGPSTVAIAPPPKVTVMAGPEIAKQCENLLRQLSNNPNLQPDSRTFNRSLYNRLIRTFEDSDCTAVLAAAPKTTPTSPISVVPPPKATVIPNVITGPGVCSVYLAKIAAIPQSTQPGAKTSDDYNFYYSVLNQNKCKPRPRVPPSSNIIGISDSRECEMNRAEIYAVDPNGDRYRSIYQVLVERKCRDLPPAPTNPSNAVPPLPATSRACDVFFKEIVENPDPKSQVYRELYNGLVTNSCSPLPAPPQ